MRRVGELELRRHVLFHEGQVAIAHQLTVIANSKGFVFFWRRHREFPWIE